MEERHLERDKRSEARGFALELAAALQGHGASAPKIEALIDGVSLKLGVDTQVFMTPTALMATWGQASRGHTALVRVRAGGVDLDRLASLEAVAGLVGEGRMSTRAGRAVVSAIVGAPDRYGAWMTTGSFGLASAASARFFGGGWRESAAALVVGLCVGLLGLALSRRQSTAPLFELVGAGAATALALWLGGVMGPMSPQIVLMSGIVVLLPGFTLTVAVSELSAGHLLSGASRLLKGLSSLLALGVGTALGGQLAWALGAPSLGAPQPLPWWTEVLALVVATMASVAIFQARLKDAPVIVAAGAVAFWGASAGTALLGPQLGTFLGAFAVGMAGEFYARVSGRPAAIPQVPGIMLLVPGSVGFRSVTAFLEGDPTRGIESAFSMGMVAVCLVTGLLAATALVDITQSGGFLERRRSAGRDPIGGEGQAER